MTNRSVRSPRRSMHARVGAAIAVTVPPLVAAIPSEPVRAAATDDVCDSSSGTNISSPTRFTALSWALGASGEGYGSAGTHCWYDDNVQTPNGNGGPDCSGFVNKAWGLRSDLSSGWRRLIITRSSGGVNRFDSKMNERPVNNTGNFQSWSVGAWKNNTGAGYAGLGLMDAPVWLHPNQQPSIGHMALVVQQQGSPFVQSLEARGDSSGTGLFNSTNVVNPSNMISDSMRYLQRNGWTT